MVLINRPVLATGVDGKYTTDSVNALLRWAQAAEDVLEDRDAFIRSLMATQDSFLREQRALRACIAALREATDGMDLVVTNPFRAGVV
jgi:hypothetical protein